MTPSQRLSTRGSSVSRSVARVPAEPYIVDLMIAATAELYEATVVHYDRDFDIIAMVTGQPVEWIVPAGSVS